MSAIRNYLKNYVRKNLDKQSCHILGDFPPDICKTKKWRIRRDSGHAVVKKQLELNI